VITSADNQKVKEARALLERRGREQQGRCLAEGVRLVEDAMRAGVVPALLFFSARANLLERARLLLERTQGAGIPAYEVSIGVLETLSDTVTSQGIIAVLPLPKPAAPGQPTGLTLVLDKMRDPGNLGTILRSAEAAGAERVVLTPGCVDPWSPKVLRAGMGAHFRVKMLADQGWESIRLSMGSRPLWLADAQGEIPYDKVDWRQPCAVTIGGETEGFDAEALALSDGRVAIPMDGDTDSLNAAMAATVLLFEAARQRRGGK
jgi:RNA methyltransferase, TrmH family